MSAAPNAEHALCPNCARPIGGAYCAHGGQKAAPRASIVAMLLALLAIALPAMWPLWSGQSP